MTFDKAAFDAKLDEIETYLGYLRGNENVRDYYLAEREYQQSNAQNAQGMAMVYLHNELDAVPCPDAAYAFKYNNMWCIDVYVTPPWDKDQYVSDLKRQIGFAYDEGMAWSSGLAAYCKSVCDQITSPDVSQFAAAIRGIGNGVIQPLTGADSGSARYVGDWGMIKTIVDDWHGNAGNTAAQFYDDFGDTVMTIVNFVGWMNYGFAAVGTLIHGCQQILDEFVTGMRDKVKEQLEAWVKYGCPPPEKPDPLPGWVKDVEKLGGDVLNIIEDKVPVVGNITEKVDNLVTDVQEWKKLADDLDSTFGWHIVPTNKTIYIATTDEIYTSLTDTLYADYYQKYIKALDNLQSGSAGASGVPSPGEARSGGKKFSGSSIMDQWNSDDWSSFPKVKSASVAGEESY